METIDTSADGHYRVRLEVDSHPVNPRRKFTRFAHVITPNGQRYSDVDLDGGPLAHGWEHFSDRDDAVALFTRWARIFHGATVVEHRPTEGVWSLWYLTSEEIPEIFCAPEEAIKAEIQEYQAWTEGEVYGYIIDRNVKWQRLDKPNETRTDWKEVFSCWGFYGLEDARFSARDAFAHRFKHNDWD